ncbi:outer dense fiber protein 3-like protein 2 [Callorhinchus milii]|uniref:outer dense fiber protein 3-like protein 2 n=1 Tax=Callorhinchus milii TaxID=7868 RepID=UPI001C3F6DFA|nr:outer dense fiber protein 3-like protein 2 [Callorhinchus milii]
MGETPDKLRPRIAAHERGPGPGRYALPPTIGSVGHDFTRHANPAYSFGKKHTSALYYSDCSPGPQYYVDPKITRFGQNGTPAYSMLGRAKHSSKYSETPGPGAYSAPSGPPLNEHRPPAYSMGSRTKYRKLDSVPAPNRYTLPSLLGPRVPTKPASASYTVSGRVQAGGFAEDLSKTPGPGKYNSTDPSVYLRRPPAYSMLGRGPEPRNLAQRPGPGAHRPEKVNLHKPSVPAFSLGVRHSEYVTPFIIDVTD